MRWLSLPPANEGSQRAEYVGAVEVVDSLHATFSCLGLIASLRDQHLIRASVPSPTTHLPVHRGLPAMAVAPATRGARDRQGAPPLHTLAPTDRKALGF